MNRFNLVDEEWIPIVDNQRISLRTLFSNSQYRSLGGNCLQIISVLKFLLAIAQRACTPADDDEWNELFHADSLYKKCLEYLEAHKDDFWLYGDRPFLQMPAIAHAKRQNYGALTPEYSTGNTTVLFESQVEPSFSDAEKILLMLQDCSFALSGKKVDLVVLSPSYSKKTASGKFGSSLGYLGYLHSFYWGSTIHDTLYMNLLTEEDVRNTGLFQEIGIPLWENMPTGEDDAVARALGNSYIGRLVPFSRIMFIADDQQLHYAEGRIYDHVKDGQWDPSVSVIDKDGKDRKSLWVDPAKRPWRNLPALLGFLGTDSQCETYQLKLPYKRIRKAFETIGIYTGGIRISSQSGEQFFQKTDDYLESVFYLQSSWLNEDWYAVLSEEMENLDKKSRFLWGRISGYYTDMKVSKSDRLLIVNRAVGKFWELCEKQFTELVQTCYEDAYGKDKNAREMVRKKFYRYFYQTYDNACPHNTPHQMEVWAKNRPRNYLSEKNTKTKEIDSE